MDADSVKYRLQVSVLGEYSGSVVLWYFSLPSTSITRDYLWLLVSVSYRTGLALRGSFEMKLFSLVVAEL